MQEENAQASALQDKIEREKDVAKEAQQRRKEYADALQELRGTSAKGKARRKIVPEASSSGRVSSSSRRLKARIVAAPYPPSSGAFIIIHYHDVYPVLTAGCRPCF